MYKLLLLFSITLLLFSCNKENNKTDKQTWSEIVIYDKLPNNPVFSKMKKMEEIISPFNQEDSLLTRSAKVTYERSRKNDFLETYTDTVFKTKAIMPHRDSLMIRISFSNGFSGVGIKLHIKRNLFTSDVYEFTDTQSVDIFGNVIEPKLTTKIYNQKLILDKHAYEIGDSIYGKMNFSLMQISDYKERKDTFYHKGAGYFRTLIKKNYY